MHKKEDNNKKEHKIYCKKCKKETKHTRHGTIIGVEGIKPGMNVSKHWDVKQMCNICKTKKM